ncbi:MAG: apolipoprotein N-acyltransferase [Pseudomonadota bacterium]
MQSDVRSHGATALGPIHEALARLKGWKAHGMAILLGALGALAFAPFHATPVLIVGVTGLIWMIDGARGQKAWGKAVFARGWAFAFGFFIVSLYWTAAPFLVEPEKHAVFLWMPLILLPGGMALIWAAGALMAGAFWSASPSRVFIFTAFFCLAEWVRGTLFGGFPWNLFGTSWTPGGAISQLAAVGGVYWLTALTVFIAAAPAALVDTRDARGLAIRLTPAFMAVIMLALGWSWGAQRLAAPTDFTSRQLVLMDVGIPQSEKWAATQEAQRAVSEQMRTRYLDLLQRTDAGADSIVIWPEGALPEPLLQSPETLDRITSQLGRRTLIAGASRYQPAGNNRYTWFNSLAVLDAGSARSGPIGLYDKHRLVPVGELPVSRILPFGDALAGVLPDAIQRMATSGFEPGPGPSITYGNGLPPFVAMICYEGLYPSVPKAAQARAAHRADWMVVISNDSWFGAVVGPQQHYAQNRYRSIETGLPMARTASRGISAVVDGYGREVSRAEAVDGDPEGWRGRLDMSDLPQAAPEPFFQRRGGVLLFWVTVSCCFALAFFTWRR